MKLLAHRPWVALTVVCVVLFFLVVVPVVIGIVTVTVKSGQPAAGTSWTVDIEKAFMQGCTMSGTAGSESERICACLLVDVKRAGKSPAEAAEVSDDILHQRTIPSWARAIFEGCQ